MRLVGLQGTWLDKNKFEADMLRKISIVGIGQIAINKTNPL